MGRVGAKEKFELEPEGVIDAELFSVVVVVLNAKLRELRWIPREVRGYSGAGGAIFT